jgi:ABC-type Fe3+ transport system substrate-binding protein
MGRSHQEELMARINVAAFILGTLLLANFPAFAQPAWQDRPAVKALYEKAKAEGEVVIWAPVQSEADWIAPEFSKRFPGIVVKGVGDLQAATKIIAEARANRHSVDVWQNSLGGMLEVQKRGLFANVDWRQLGLTDDRILFGGEGLTLHNFVYSTLYAKDFVKEAELPKTWDDLLNPKWKGKMVSQDFLLPRLMGFLALVWGEQRTEKWGRAIINDQNTLIVNSPRESFLKTGERVLSIGDSVTQSYQYTDNGVPTGYTVLDVVPAVQFMVSTMKKAPHPNAARLLAAWLATDEGLARREELVHGFSIRPGSKSKLAEQITAAKAKIVLEDVSTMAQRAGFYKKFSALVRGR